ncbi:MAG: hypothetical protein KDD94_11700 [Calditrichaeota bacterium]|nr:hypothetical protein [Calditrichota bacterium]
MRILNVIVVIILLSGCSQNIDEINEQIKLEQEKGNKEVVYTLYQKILDEFEGTDHYATALFQMAFMNSNEFSRLDLAKAQYEEFLKKFPNHELASSARFELKYIGMPVDEIPVIKDSLNAKREMLVQ